MGHKVHPTGFRLGVVKNHLSRWYAERDYKELLAEDFKLRKIISKELANASISRIEIERAAANQVAVTIYTAKPGIVIGKSGEKVDKLRASLEKQTKKRVRLNIIEIRQPELDAFLVARNIAEQLEKRVSFRRAMKQAVQKSMRANAKGIRVIVGGRLGGAEIARSEKEVEGKIPLHTLRADIDYGITEAHTTFGVIGVKVWIYKGDILPEKRREGLDLSQEAAAQPTFTPREGGDRRGGRGQRGERGPRPQGERGERGPRPQGERGPRPQGERGERGPRPQGERGPRTPRPMGDRPARPPRGERPAASAEAAPPENQEAVKQAATEAPISTPPVEQAPATPVQQTPPPPAEGASESE